MKLKSGLTKFAPNDLYKMDFKMQIHCWYSTESLYLSVYITGGPNSQVAFTLYIHSNEIAVETPKQPLKVTAVLLVPAKPKKTPQK
jgi:hypothetical protein